MFGFKKKGYEPKTNKEMFTEMKPQDGESKVQADIRERRYHNRIDQCVLRGRQGILVLEHIEIVLEHDEVHGLRHTVPIRQAVVEAGEHGEDEEKQINREGGDNKKMKNRLTVSQGFHLDDRHALVVKSGGGPPRGHARHHPVGFYHNFLQTGIIYSPSSTHPAHPTPPVWFSYPS